MLRLELQKSIAALNVEAEYIRRCINAGLRERESGNNDIKEISDLIKELEAKLKCMN